MSLMLTVCCCVLAQSEVVVRPLRGEPVRGELRELSEKSVTIQTQGGARVFETSGLLAVKSATAATPSDPRAGVWVDLIDGSQFPGSTYVATSGKATVKNVAGEEIELPTRLVRTVRFHTQDNSVRKQWMDILGGAQTGDVLVIRKVNQPGSAAGDVLLDQLSGVVHEVRDTSVAFEFDGDRVDVARTKVEGIIFRQQAAGELREPVCRVKDLDGSQWNVKSIQLQDNRITLVSVAGAQVTLPVSRLSEVDFSAANLVYLNDLQPESVEWRPYFQSAATPSSLSKWFEPKDAPLILYGESYERGLALHSRTLVSYRLTRNYRQFAAKVGIDERFRGTANLQLVVSGDGRTLLSRTVKGDDEPFDIELNIDGVRRLRILVDFGDDRSDAGDLLYLCNARLMK